MPKLLHTASQILERLSALHRNLMRKLAADVGLQMVHIEILQYISACNKYSDTTQAISEYLGLTKGSISQSLGHLETNNYIKRIQDRSDKRVFHLSLTTKGIGVVERWLQYIAPHGLDEHEPALKSILVSMQQQNGFREFGTCITCKFNQRSGERSFTCGLTNEKLSLGDTLKICREHHS